MTIPIHTPPDVTQQLRPAAAAGGAVEEDSSISWSTRKGAVVAAINEKLKSASVGVRFQFDKETDTVITRVIEVETGRLIRQMQPEEVMQLSKDLSELHDLLALQAICRKAQLTDRSRPPAPARWRSSWTATAVKGPDAAALRSVKI